MLKIDQVEWGRIIINGKEFKQVLIIGDEVYERDSEALHQLFGTTHKISDLEREKLFMGKPDVVIIGSGWEGLVEVNQGIKERSRELDIKLVILKTPLAVGEYNKITDQKGKINALIHTTC